MPGFIVLSYLPGCLPDIAEPPTPFEFFEDAKLSLVADLTEVGDSFEDEGDDRGEAWYGIATEVDLWTGPDSVHAPDGRIYEVLVDQP